MREETCYRISSLKNYRQLGQFAGERISTNSQNFNKQSTNNFNIPRLPAGRLGITEKQNMAVHSWFGRTFDESKEVWLNKNLL